MPPSEPFHCPLCRGGTLIPRFGCLAASFRCASCDEHFDLGRLALLLDDDAFEQVALAVAHRLSDRV